MNLRGPIIALFCISCNHHPAPAVKSTAIAPDTAANKVVNLPATPVDTSRPVQSTPGPPVIFTTDLNNDGISDTITLISSTADTVTFDIVSIAIARFGKQTFHTAHPWTTVDDWFLDSNKNAIPTSKFFLAKGKLQSVLLLFGDIDEAGNRDDFSIVNIENNRAKLVLNQVERHLYIEAPISLSDQNGDGRLDFLYRQIFQYGAQPETDSLGGLIGPYSPYFIYTVDDNCVLNKALTTRYNQANYLFAGFNYDESIQVFYPDDKGKPRLWKK